MIESSESVKQILKIFLTDTNLNKGISDDSPSQVLVKN